MSKRRLLPYTLFYGILIAFCITVFIFFKLLPDEKHVTFTLSEPVNYWAEDVHYEQLSMKGKDLNRLNVSEVTVQYPIILWWNPLTGEQAKIKTCDGKAKCLLTTNRLFQYHPQTKVFLFYGTDFDKDDLPLPRAASHEWGLFHEESPKNNYILTQEDVITLFNHTATFQRSSDYPLTTQYIRDLEDLTSDQFFVPLEQKKKIAGLAPLVYIHSDCNPPSDRDTYVAELMKHIQVDSYGKCLHNKDLPLSLREQTAMDDPALHQILAQYRFALSIENAVCNDYITEKLWRPLSLGSVPIYKGSPSVRDWLPTNHSVIFIDEFETPKDLADYVQFLMDNDSEYKKYLQFREKGVWNEKLKTAMQAREWGVNDFEKVNFITGFECFVCSRVHANLNRIRRGEKPSSYSSKPDHLSCPRPQALDLSGKHSDGGLYQLLYDQSIIDAMEVRRKVSDKNLN